MPVQSPGCRPDPGWLFVAAGLALCAAGLLVPAQLDLEVLQAQRSELLRQRELMGAQVQGHEAFLEQLRREDPAVIRRLAAAHLNLVPAGETPVLIASSRQAPVGEWIADTVQARPDRRDGPPDTWLVRLTGERFRLWVLAGGLLAVFVGLLAGPDPLPVRQGRGLIPRWRPDLFRPRALGSGVEWDGDEDVGEDLEDEGEEVDAEDEGVDQDEAEEEEELEEEDDEMDEDEEELEGEDELEEDEEEEEDDLADDDEEDWEEDEEAEEKDDDF